MPYIKGACKARAYTGFIEYIIEDLGALGDTEDFHYIKEASHMRETTELINSVRMIAPVPLHSTL